MAHQDGTQSGAGTLAATGAGATPSQISRRLKNRLDIAGAFLLSMAALASSWAGYQSARWSSVQSSSYSTASARWLESSRVATFAALYQSLDLEMFMQWLGADMAGDDRRARLFRDRFRPEFRPAFEAWLAARPKDNPAAPGSPFLMPEYRVERYERAGQLEAEARAAADLAQAAKQQGDDYVFSTVIFAATLFFAGIASHFGSLRTRAVVLGIAAALGLVGLIELAVYPVQ